MCLNMNVGEYGVVKSTTLVAHNFIYQQYSVCL